MGLEDETSSPTEPVVNNTTNTTTIDDPKSIIQKFEQKDNNNVVDLSNSYLGDEALPKILSHASKYPKKTSIDLKGNHIQTTGAITIASFLKSNRTIVTLNLEWNNIGLLDMGIIDIARALEINSSLRELDLRNNNIGGDGAVALAKALRNNKTLVALDLRWNDIGSIGGKAFADTLSDSNQTLEVLSINGNNVPTSLCEKIEQYVSRNQHGVCPKTSLNDGLLLDVLSEKEISDKKVSESSAIVEKLREKLHEQVLATQEAEIKLRRQTEITSRVSAQLAEKTELLNVAKTSKEEFDKELSANLAAAVQDRAILEKKCAALKNQIASDTIASHKMTSEYERQLQTSQDEIRQVKSQEKKNEISLASLTLELERARDALDQERKRWATERQEAATASSEKYQILETKLANVTRECEEKIFATEKQKIEIESKRQAAVKEIEELQAQLLSASCKRQEELCELENRMTIQVEDRVKSSLKSVESRLASVIDARDCAQKTVEDHISNTSILTQEHLDQIQTYEGEISKLKTSLRQAHEVISEKQSEVVKSESVARNLQHQVTLMSSKYQELEKKYESFQELQNTRMAGLNEELRNDRLEWEKAMAGKSNLISELEAAIQKKDCTISSLKSSQERRLMELGDAIEGFVRQSFTKEKVRIHEM